MSTERQAPDTIALGTNYTSPVVTDIDDDPDSPDANWLVWDGNGNTACRVTFPTPSGNPSGTQTFRVQIRNDAAGSNITDWSLELWENGVQVSVLATGSDPAGVVVEGTWDAASLGTADGSLVECALIQKKGGGGNASKRKGIEVGAIEWNVEYAEAGITVSPLVGSALLSGVIPTLSLSDYRNIPIPVGVLAFSSIEPIINLSDHLDIDIADSSLVFSSDAPTLIIASPNHSIPVDVQNLVLTGQQLKTVYGTRIQVP